ncbi:MAG: CaiB/BaiF CoA-transferase family protein [Syntrophomonadaceae bacterium]
MSMPLQGIRILDLSRLLPGPFCSMILADMGAEVLKVEPPDQIDPFRKVGPFVKDEGAAYMMLNRNKRSMTLNLGNEQGKAIFRELARNHDIILEQFRPGVVDRLGIGYEDIKKINPQIIYCSISGFGQDGPYRDMGSHDINHIGISGVLEALRPLNGPASIPRVPLGGAVGGALWAANAILTALVGRERNGSGQYLDVSITDGLLPLHCLFAGQYLDTGQAPRYNDSQVTGAYAYYNIYETADRRYLTLGAYESKFWSAFCQHIGHPEFSSEQFAPEARQREIIEVLQGIFKTRTLAEWTDELGALDLCLIPAKNLAEVFDDPHFRARNMVTEIEYADGSSLSTIAHPVKFSQAVAQVKYPPPAHGEHTGEVLRGLGYSEEQIEELQRSRVI